MKNAILLFALLPFAVFGQSKPVRLDYSLQMRGIMIPFADTTVQKREVNLCSLFTRSAWDTMYVVMPYTQEERVKALGLAGTAEITPSLWQIERDDRNELVLFVTDRKIVAYWMAERIPSFVEYPGKPIKTIPRGACVVEMERIDDMLYYRQKEIQN